MKTYYFVSADKTLLDTVFIHQFLTQCYWAQGIPYDTVVKSIDGSLCFGVYTEQNQQVGFARMITDKATFAYLADVFIIDEHRGQGLAKQLMDFIVSHPELQGLRRMVLATRDAHALYQQFNFSPLATPDIFMECHDASVYLNN